MKPNSSSGASQPALEKGGAADISLRPESGTTNSHPIRPRSLRAVSKDAAAAPPVAASLNRLWKQWVRIVKMLPPEVASPYRPGWVGQFLRDIQVNDNDVPPFVREPFTGRSEK